MAKLSGANLPDWLAQWAMDRGAIDDPSLDSSASSSGLFDQPMIRRRRPEMMDDERDDSWMDSGRSDQYVSSSPTASSNNQLNMGEVLNQELYDIDRGPGVINERGSVPLDTQYFDGKNVAWGGGPIAGPSTDNSLGSLAKGASDIFSGMKNVVESGMNNVQEMLGGGGGLGGMINKLGEGGASLSFLQGFNDSTQSPGAKFAGLMGALGSSAMGMSAAPVSILGGIFNGLGYHKDWDPGKNASLSYNPEGQRLSWEGAAGSADNDGGGGGHQYNVNRNMENMLEDIDQRYNQGDGMKEWVQWEQPDGRGLYADPAELASYMRDTTNQYGNFLDYGDYGSPGVEGLFTNNPFSMQRSEYHDYEDKLGGPNMSNRDALNSLENRSGQAWNAVEGNGYNEQVANAAKAAESLRNQMYLDSETWDDDFGGDGGAVGSSDQDSDSWGSFDSDDGYL
jgi:hypothetical protein